MHGGHPVASAGQVLSRVARLTRALPAEDQRPPGIIKPLKSAFLITVVLMNKVPCRVRVAHNDVTQEIAHVTPQWDLCETLERGQRRGTHTEKQ
jgi:hypothetical protein